MAFFLMVACSATITLSGRMKLNKCAEKVDASLKEGSQLGLR